MIFSFIYLFGFVCAGSLFLLPAFSSCREWGLLFVVVGRLSMWWFLFLQSTGSRVCRFQSLWYRGLIAPWHAEIFWVRDQTHVPHVGRRVLTAPPGKSCPCIPLRRIHPCMLLCRTGARSRTPRWMHWPLTIDGGWGWSSEQGAPSVT